ncbi:MAG: hypothetical protein AAGD35_23010 [Actinomycetota bacterium]
MEAFRAEPPPRGARWTGEAPLTPAKGLGFSPAGLLLIGAGFSASAALAVVDQRLFAFAALVASSLLLVALPLARTVHLRRTSVPATVRYEAFAVAERARRLERLAQREQAYLNLQPPTYWYPVRQVDPGRHIDIFGGGPLSWMAHLGITLPRVAGTGPILVLDLSQLSVADQVFAALAAVGGAEADADINLSFPADFPARDPLRTVANPAEVASLLTADLEDETSSFADDLELGLYQLVGDALGDEVTVGRYAAAFNALIRSPYDHNEQLSPDELDRLLVSSTIDRLGSNGHDRLSRASMTLNTMLRHSRPDMAGLPNWPAEAIRPFVGNTTTLIGTDDGLPPKFRRRLDNFLVAAATDWVRTEAPPSARVIVIDAGRVHADLLTGLITATRRVSAALTLVFEQLKPPAKDLLGRSDAETILYRLGNREDAEVAANFIGKDLRFVLSSITASVGSQRGSTRGTSTTVGTSETTGSSTSQSTSTSTGRSHNYDGRSFFALVNSTNRSTGQSRSDTVTTNQSTTLSQQESTSNSNSYTDTDNYAEARNRSEEFRVRPEQLQELPPTGFFHVATVDGAKQVTLADCHPDLETAPYIAPDPLDPMLRRQRLDALATAAGSYESEQRVLEQRRDHDRPPPPLHHQYQPHPPGRPHER